ncbi:hypothetical protein SLEP1_g50344 [Rubroshorea leprosula]|uniref:Uncharacterized protein n=1 Tax=Rubroshorea leprosula TaxID=152421 RepID=A0AAV5M2T5_9ROSI|nr:hypothetical protein SLEP1_g50344 [Rubroshorea leprosula]
MLNKIINLVLCPSLRAIRCSSKYSCEGLTIKTSSHVYKNGCYTKTKNNVSNVKNKSCGLLLTISSSSQPPPSSPVITKAEGFGSYQKWGEDEADLAGNHRSEAFTESPTHRRQVERRAACGVRRS